MKKHKKHIDKVVNLAPETSDKNLSRSITPTQLSRVSQDIKRWRSATQSAESLISPSRTELLRTYKDILLDAHLQGIIAARKNKLLSGEFSLINADGEIDIESTKILKTTWFEKFIKLSLDALLFGCEVIQLDNLVDNKFQYIEKIPEEYVLQQKMQIKTNISATSGIDFNVEPYINWVVFVGSTTDLGILFTAAPYVIWKKNALGAWSEAAEIFGMPLRIGKTDIHDETRRKQMDAMLANMGSAAWATLDTDDKVEIVGGTSSTKAEIYKQLAEFCNSELSKLVLGNTMSTDNGSSLSQAEVHERVSNEFANADKRFIENTVNDSLMSILIYHKILPEGLVFRYDTKEHMEPNVIADIVSKLSGSYIFSDEEISKRLGFKVERRKDAPQQVATPKAISKTMASVSDLYSSYFTDKHTH